MTSRGWEPTFQSGDDGGLEQKVVTTHRAQNIHDSRDTGTPVGSEGALWVVVFSFLISPFWKEYMFLLLRIE